MTNRESDAIVMYLHGARIDWSEKITPIVLLVWFDALKPFRAEMAEAAIQAFHGQRPTARQGFPPDIGEVVEYLYRCGQAEDLRTRPHHEAIDRDTATKLLSGPVASWGAAESLPATAVQLVRDLMEGTVMPGSDDHQRRQQEIVGLAGGVGPPCCDRDGLTSYEVIAHGIRRTNAARCDCPRGQASAYRSYPVVDRSRPRVDTSVQDFADRRAEGARREVEYAIQRKQVFG